MPNAGGIRRNTRRSIGIPRLVTFAFQAPPRAAPRTYIAGPHWRFDNFHGVYSG
ncbi:MAG TPA: hypothetical protein VMK12_08990 [Anaeromyxobacteraceae bacterium]|nr:hypothetical protein [Anaeromyxobacteraceae bacterium]